MNKIEITVQNYAPTNCNFKAPDQSSIWVNVHFCEDGEDDYIGSGYIDNPFPLDYFGAVGEEFRRETFSGVLVKTVIMEHANGGRSNNKQYSSLLEYLADPLVKELCRKSITGGLAYSFSSDGGDPDNIDYVNTCKFDQFPEEFEISHTTYDSIVPQAWLNEFNSDTIIGLGKCAVWPDADKAIAESTVEDDLFGLRAFPVLKAPIGLTSKMQSICGWFKSCSEPLSDSEFVYIGIRAKTYEIDTIREIYEAGGWILCDQQWDW